MLRTSKGKREGAADAYAAAVRISLVRFVPYSTSAQICTTLTQLWEYKPLACGVNTLFLSLC